MTMNSQIESPQTPAAATTAEPSEAVAAVLTGATELARQAIVEFSGDTVGEYLGVAFEDDTAATHRFLARMPGYQGWQWAVVVAAYPGADHVSPLSLDTEITTRLRVLLYSAQTTYSQSRRGPRD